MKEFIIGGLFTLIIIGIFGLLVAPLAQEDKLVRSLCTKTELVVGVKGRYNAVYDCTGVER